MASIWLFILLSNCCVWCRGLHLVDVDYLVYQNNETIMDVALNTTKKAREIVYTCLKLNGKEFDVSLRVSWQFRVRFSGTVTIYRDNLIVSVTIPDGREFSDEVPLVARSSQDGALMTYNCYDIMDKDSLEQGKPDRACFRLGSYVSKQNVAQTCYESALYFRYEAAWTSKKTTKWPFELCCSHDPVNTNRIYGPYH